MKKFEREVKYLQIHIEGGIQNPDKVMWYEPYHMTVMKMNPIIGKNIDDENISLELGDDSSCTFSNLKSAIIPGSSLGGTDPNTRLILAYVNSEFLQIDVITISNTNYGLKTSFSTKF